MNRLAILSALIVLGASPALAQEPAAAPDRPLPDCSDYTVP